MPSAAIAEEEPTLTARLERARWPSGPVCPYCQSQRCTPLRGEARHHCNFCNTSFSVLTGTPLHGTRVSPEKWIAAAAQILVPTGREVTARGLALEIGVHRNTACRMIRKIHFARHEHPILLAALASLVSKDR